jgi:acetylornithine deacetylase
MRATAPEATIVTQVEIEVPGLAPEPGSAAEQLAFRLTKSNRTHAVAFATEAGRFQAAHVPTVVCGPGSIDQAHQPVCDPSVVGRGQCIQKRHGS